MLNIVSVSGGLASYEALDSPIERFGKEHTCAVFADVKGSGKSHYWSKFPVIEELLHERNGGESADTYRFIWQLSHALDIDIERLEHPEKWSIWTTFTKRRNFRLFVNGFFYAPCSEQLKRWLIADWLKSTFAPGSFRLVLGMGWDESHRVEKARVWWSAFLGYAIEVSSPLLERPYVDNCILEEKARNAGLEVPSAYNLGFSHNNCGGGCVQGGQGDFALLYHHRRDVYDYWEWQERQIVKHWAKGSENSILKTSKGGVTRPLPLSEFREWIERGEYDVTDKLGCGCFGKTPQMAFYDVLAETEKK